MNKSFEQFVKEYQKSVLTKKAYANSLEMFDRYLKGKEPTERTVEEYMLALEGKGLASASVNRHLSAIRAYFLWRKKHSPPEKRGYWDLMVEGPKVHNKLVPIFPVEDIIRILDVCQTTYEKAFIMLLYDGALRISELMGIQVEDVDFKEKQVKVTRKGEDEQMIPLGDETTEALKEYIGNRQGLVFPLPYWKLLYDLKRLGHKAGVNKLHPHLFRHARAQNLRENGVKVEDVKDFLGHKDISTTMRYFQGDPKMLRKKITKAF
jgi:site-specific recombinase XerD